MPDTLKKLKKGTALVEVMIAVVILVIVILGGSYFFVYGRSQIDLQKHYRVATHLAAQKLEELKADSYNNIAAGYTTETLSLENLSYSRTLTTADVGLYKAVEVTVNWQQLGRQHSVSLDTFIAPK